MKVTKENLKKIIKEELEEMMVGEAEAEVVPTGKKTMSDEDKEEMIKNNIFLAKKKLEDAIRGRYEDADRIGARKLLLDITEKGMLEKNDPRFKQVHDVFQALTDLQTALTNLSLYNWSKIK